MKKSRGNYKHLLAIIFVCLLIYAVFESQRYEQIDILDESEAQCGRFVPFNEVPVDNEIWQLLELPNGFVKLLNAYLDTRENKKLVRINVVGIHIDIKTDPIYCQFWFDDESAPYVVQPDEYMWLWINERKELLQPYLIVCPILFEGKTPTSISLTTSPCDEATNHLKIIDNQPKNGKKAQFGVCMKNLVYDDRKTVIRFIEWVHMMQILGAEGIHVYDTFVHPEMFEILNYYGKKGIVETKPFVNPTGIFEIGPTAFQTWLLEMTILNDCFYRNRNLYEWIVIVDIDEVILPAMDGDFTWNDLLKRIDNPKEKDSLVHKNAFFPRLDSFKPNPNIPEYLYMLQHTERSVEFTDNIKSILNPDRLYIVWNHKAWYCFTGHCNHFDVPTNISFLAHYRSNVGDPKHNKTIVDTRMLKYKETLMAMVNATLVESKFKP
jgi:hypothetical protein